MPHRETGESVPKKQHEKRGGIKSGVYLSIERNTTSGLLGIPRDIVDVDSTRLQPRRKINPSRRSNAAAVL